MLRRSPLSKRRLKGPYFILLLAHLPFVGCIENPFGGGEDISAGTRQVSGTLQLNDRASPEGTFVWLESFNIGTHADASGKFSLTLPPPGATGGSGATGLFNLYFYLANYKLSTATVATRNGAFIYAEAEINKEGVLNNTKSLRKFLRINTVLTPATISSSSTTPIGVDVTLQAVEDSVTVVIPNTLNGGIVIGALLIRSLDRQEVFTYYTLPNSTYKELLTLRASQTARLDGTISLLNLPLLPGDYEVIPYILIRHQALPPGMIDALGPDLENLSPNYLQIPMRREGGNLQITP